MKDLVATSATQAIVILLRVSSENVVVAETSHQMLEVL